MDSGLLVSVMQMSKGLAAVGVANKVVQVIDNSFIYKEINTFKPTHVVVEALWVVPSKFDELMPMYPGVKWIVRNHSKAAFLAHEGSVFGWTIDYLRRGMTLACNSREAAVDFRSVAKSYGYKPEQVAFLPNYYDVPSPENGVMGPGERFLNWLLERYESAANNPRDVTITYAPHTLHVGCFGAIRSLKNHVHQAMAAIMVADYLGKELYFHANTTRVEGKADSILVALRGLFERHNKHQLIYVPWMRHQTFVGYVTNMDVVTQVSNSETFNIVAADATVEGVPVVVSDEVPWLSGDYHADPNDVQDITKKMLHMLANRKRVAREQLHQLILYTRETIRLWNQFLTIPA